MRALIIEDEVELNRLLAIAMRNAGFSVSCEFDGRNGLSKASKLNFDLVVLDMLLPERNGQLVLEEIRKVKPVPVLIITAIDNVEDRIAALNAGADDYMVKPFNLAEFVARSKALVRRSSNHPKPVLTLAGIQIDTMTRQVNRGNEALDFTPTEYSLLEMLALSRGQIVSRSQIYEHLFDEDDAGFSNLIDVHMSHLRKKLGSDMIRTVRGYGYIIDDVD
ncbi:UNVERIFIED_CONTAM: hypothetical protein GTU68_023400 [Idotea baltica]|nr:hypothetical protein [Idotea baltica]